MAVDIEAREKEISNAVAGVVNGWTRAAVVALYRQIKICDPHLPSLTVDLEILYRKELKRDTLKMFQE